MRIYAYEKILLFVDLVEMDNRQDEVRIKAFGKNLRRIREEKGLSLQGLALESDVAKSTVERIEMGEVDTRMTTISKLAAALGVDPGDLFVFPMQK